MKKKRTTKKSEKPKREAPSAAELTRVLAEYGTRRHAAQAIAEKRGRGDRQSALDAWLRTARKATESCRLVAAGASPTAEGRAAIGRVVAPTDEPMIDELVAMKQRLALDVKPDEAPLDSPAWWASVGRAIDRLRMDMEALVGAADRTARKLDHVTARSPRAGRPDDAATAWLLRAVEDRGWSLRGVARALVAAKLADDEANEYARLKNAKHRAK
jgi:hypothetical protein